MVYGDDPAQQIGAEPYIVTAGQVTAEDLAVLQAVGGKPAGGIGNAVPGDLGGDGDLVSEYGVACVGAVGRPETQVAVGGVPVVGAGGAEAGGDAPRAGGTVIPEEVVGRGTVEVPNAVV